MKIPNELQLMGLKIKTKIHDHIIIENNTIGEAHFNTHTIYLVSERVGVAKEAIELTYIHELVHFILYMLGKNDLNQNEEFITTFSNLLHQAIIQLTNKS
jgi:predicted SprT family Zn-dependent metalloprotease